MARGADLQSLVFKGNVLESDILKLAVCRDGTVIIGSYG